MTDKQIETILTRAIETAYSKQSEEISKKLGAVEDAVESAIDSIPCCTIRLNRLRLRVVAGDAFHRGIDGAECPFELG